MEMYQIPNTLKLVKNFNNNCFFFIVGITSKISTNNI